MISFIIPAHNEEAVISQTLTVLLAAAGELNEAFEIIVVDDASTDRTGEIARSLGARVERVELRQIAAVRNAGARVTEGKILFFIDADTHVTVRTLRQARQALSQGAVGGGAIVKLEQNAPIWGKIITWLFGRIWFGLDWAAGCFVFARRDAFERIGGFDEKYFLGEEMYISKALKSLGNFVIVREPVITSARKFRTYSAREMLGAMAKLLGNGPSSWQARENARWWYEGRREPPGTVKGDSPG